MTRAKKCPSLIPDFCGLDLHSVLRKGQLNSEVRFSITKTEKCIKSFERHLESTMVAYNVNEPY